MRFKDRKDAGQQLVNLLQPYTMKGQIASC